MSKSVKLLESLNAPSKDLECQSEFEDGRTKRKKVADVPSHALCKDPVRYVCDPELNPLAKESLYIGRETGELEMKFALVPYIQEFIKKELRKESTQCPEIENEKEKRRCEKRVSNNRPTCSSIASSEERKKCYEFVSQEITNHLFTKDRMKRAYDLFDIVKDEFANYLKRKVEALKENQELEKAEELKEILSEVKKTDLKFDYDDSGFNLDISFSHYLLREKWNSFLSSNDISLKRLINLFDVAPDAFQFLFDHEISHLAVNQYELAKDRKNYPFESQLSCLKRKDSIAAKLADAECFRKKSIEYGKGAKPGSYGEFKAKEMLNYAELAKNNPEFFVSNPEPQGVNVCQQGQLTEAFADLVSIDALMDRDTWTQDKIVQMVSLQCAQYLDRRFHGNKNLRLDSHPLPWDRINKLVFAHPKIRKLFGCAPPKSKNSSESASGVVYCGGN